MNVSILMNQGMNSFLKIVIMMCFIIMAGILVKTSHVLDRKFYQITFVKGFIADHPDLNKRLVPFEVTVFHKGETPVWWGRNDTYIQVQNVSLRNKRGEHQFPVNYGGHGEYSLKVLGYKIHGCIEVPAVEVVNNNVVVQGNVVIRTKGLPSTVMSSGTFSVVVK